MGISFALGFFYDQAKWHCWLPIDNEIIAIQGQPAESLYFSEKAERPDDLYYSGLNFIAQHASYPAIDKALFAIINDIHNLSSALSILDLLFLHRHASGGNNRRLVATQIEYIFTTCRSIFDFLQEIACKLWVNIRLVDSNRRKRELKKSFADMTGQGTIRKTPSQLEEQYGLSKEWAELYVNYADFFLMIRAFRDNIIHAGTNFDFVFCTERGFAIPDDSYPFQSFNVWNEQHKLENGLSSLRPALAYIIKTTIKALDDLCRAMSHNILFPPPIAPNFNLYIRGYHTYKLKILDEIIAECKWYDE